MMLLLRLVWWLRGFVARPDRLQADLDEARARRQAASRASIQHYRT